MAVLSKLSKSMKKVNPRGPADVLSLDEWQMMYN